MAASVYKLPRRTRLRENLREPRSVVLGPIVGLMFQEPGVRQADSFSKRDLGFPTEVAEALPVEKLLICAVRLGLIPADFASIADDLGDEVCEVCDAQVRAAADVNRQIVVVVVEQEVTRL